MYSRWIAAKMVQWQLFNGITMPYDDTTTLEIETTTAEVWDPREQREKCQAICGVTLEKIFLKSLHMHD